MSFHEVLCLNCEGDGCSECNYTGRVKEEREDYEENEDLSEENDDLDDEDGE